MTTYTSPGLSVFTYYMDKVQTAISGCAEGKPKTKVKGANGYMKDALVDFDIFTQLPKTMASRIGFSVSQRLAKTSH